MTEGTTSGGPAFHQEHPSAQTSPVDCYSGHTYAQEPRAVTWRGQRYLVVEVEQRWRTPEGPAFRVWAGQGDPLRRFELHYHELGDRWTVLLLPAGDHELDQGPR